MSVIVEPLRQLERNSLETLAAESEREGFRLIRRLLDDWDSGANRFDRPGELLVAARSGGRVVGVCGLNVDPFAGDDRVGRVRHLYVLPRFRRRGVGRLLLATIGAAADKSFDRLRLRTANPAAARFYEALGFRPAGAGIAGASHIMERAAFPILSTPLARRR